VPTTARRICEPCAARRLARLRPGGEPGEVMPAFAVAVNRLAAALGIGRSEMAYGRRAR
jgi:hypothetical protein